MAKRSPVLNPAASRERDLPLDPRSRQSPLIVYNYYRIALAGLLLLIHALTVSREPLLGASNPTLFSAIALLYLLISLASTFLLKISTSPVERQALVLITLDIIILTLLIHANGGIEGTLSMLLIVSVAAGNILVSGRLGIFFAAVATIAVFYEHFYFSLNQSLSHQGFTNAALLGIAFFAVSLIAQQLARRTRASEAIAEARGEEITQLQQLNQHIIERLRTGILVVNDEGYVVLSNDSAKRMLSPEQELKGHYLADISQPLDRQLTSWLTNSEHNRQPIIALDGSRIAANFTFIRHSKDTSILVFLDDTSQIAQQAQQLKLASLGRFTASIAHEIRNPLGAISHAAQLLQEAPGLDAPDKRLVDIIQHHSVRMNNIIENILMLSRRRSATPELLNLEDWLARFREEYLAGRPAGADIELHAHSPSVHIRFDALQLSQVLTNLCDNGLRYSLKNGQQRLAITTAIRDDELPILEVQDFGTDVSDDIRQQLFEPFFTTDAEGTGLGLYICRELCEANQARLDYIAPSGRLTPGSGACFRITFAHPDRAIQ